MQMSHCLAAAFIFVALAGCETTTSQPQPTAGIAATVDLRPVPILRHTAINDPGLAESGVLLLNSRSEIENQMPGASALAKVEVDFVTESLVVLCLGQRPTGGYWAQVTGVQFDPDEDALYVQGIANRPGPQAMVTQALTYPCAAAVIPKTQATTLHPEIESHTDMPQPKSGNP